MTIRTDAPSRALEIRLFGPPSIHVGGDSMPRLRSRKGLWLLSLLALRSGREVDRTWLAGTLWPESLEYQALASMRRTLTDLRDALGTEAARIVSVGSKSLMLDLEGAECDVTLFDRLVDSHDEADLLKAAALYRGPLLEGCLEEWVSPERRAREERCIGALEELAELAIARGAPSEAAGCLQSVLRIDPFREAACRTLMQALDATGQPAAALQAYREFREKIWAEIHSAPSAETTALYESIRAVEQRKAVSTRSAASETPVGSSSPVRIKLFGELELIVDGRSTNRFETRKTALLLARLALGLGRTFSREELADLLWPGDEIDLSRERLRKALGAIRQQLGGLAEQALESDRVSIRLAPTVVETDLRRWEAATKLLSAEDEDVRSRVERVLAAAELRDEPLLPSFVESWIIAARQQADESFTATLVEAAKLSLASGESGLAYRAAQRALTIDPLNEFAVAAMIDALTALGRQSEAAQAHADYARRLDRELGMRPGAELEAKAAALRGAAPAMPKGPEPFPPAPITPASAGSFGLSPGVTAFFGREDELQRLAETLGIGEAEPRARLVTLLGTGGSGKTRLASEFARRVFDERAMSVAFVPLADLDHPDRVLDVVLDVLGVAADRRDPIEQVADVLGNGPALLVLDNFEHIVDAAPIVSTMLSAMPELMCVVTSRVLLELHGEHAFPVLPLPTPKRPGTPDELQDYASVRLFVDRAIAARPDFVLSAANAPAVVALCEFLEGIPLALELAAGRAAVLTPEEMLGQIEDRFDFLVSRRRDVPERHRTLRAAIDWSYENLSEASQRFFRRLSVFRGGWTLDAAREVCDAKDAIGIMEDLRARSLIIPESRGGTTRYRMLDTIREVGNEALAEAERREVLARHAEFFSRAATESMRLFFGAAAPDSIRESASRVELIYENARAALEELIRQDREPERALKLAQALDAYAFLKGHLAEGHALLVRVLDMRSMSAETRCDALCTLARRACSEGLIDQAGSLIEEAMRVAEAEDDEQLSGYVAGQAANVYIDLDELDLALEALSRAASIQPELKNRVGHLTIWGIVHQARGELEQALEYHLRCVELTRSGVYSMHTGWSLGNAAEVLYALGRYEDALPYIREAVEFMRRSQDVPGQTDCMRLLAQTLVRLDRGRETDIVAATVLETENSRRRLSGFAMRKWERESREACMETLRLRLDGPEFAAACDRGRELSLEEAVLLVLGKS